MRRFIFSMLCMCFLTFPLGGCFPLPIFDFPILGVLIDFTEKSVKNIIYSIKVSLATEAMTKGLGNSVGMVTDVMKAMDVYDDWLGTYRKASANVANAVADSLKDVTSVKDPCEITVNQGKLENVVLRALKDATKGTSKKLKTKQENLDTALQEIYDIVVDEIREDIDIESYERKDAVKIRVRAAVANMLAAESEKDAFWEWESFDVKNKAYLDVGRQLNQDPNTDVSSILVTFHNIQRRFYNASETEKNKALQNIVETTHDIARLNTIQAYTVGITSVFCDEGKNCGNELYDKIKQQALNSTDLRTDITNNTISFMQFHKQMSKTVAMKALQLQHDLINIIADNPEVLTKSQ